MKLRSLIMAVSLFACGTGMHDSAATPPNLIFLLADDLRYDALGCNGNELVQTPSIDALAEQGVSFNRAFVTTSICMISRASIMTGQYAAAHGVLDFRTALTEDQLRQSYFQQLKDAGYSLGFVGKWGVGNPPQELFDFNAAYAGQGSFYGPPTDSETHLTTYLGKKAAAYLAAQDKQRPFCLSVSFKSPHVDDGNLERPFNYDRELSWLYADTPIEPMPLSNPAFFAQLPEFLQKSENRIRWHQRFATDEMYQESVRSYWRLVTGMDNVVGALLVQLQELGLADNTIVVFTSDNGFYLGERGFAGKWYPHEVSIQVPLIIYDPRQSGDSLNSRRDEMALNIDIAPTLLDYAGIAPPEVMQGRSLRAIVEGDNVDLWRDEFYYEHFFDHATIPFSEGVRTERFKYIVYPQVDPPYEELYDLDADPIEEHNLASDPDWQETLDDLRERLTLLRRQAQQARLAQNPRYRGDAQNQAVERERLSGVRKRWRLGCGCTGRYNWNVAVAKNSRSHVCIREVATARRLNPHLERRVRAGQLETRHYSIMPLPDSMSSFGQKWRKLNSIGQIVREVEGDGKVTSETSYYILSSDAKVGVFSESARSHWGIENGLHWVMDVVLGEDQSRIRKGHAAENLSFLRRFVTTLLKHDTSKSSLKQKRKDAAWDTDFLESLLFR